MGRLGWLLGTIGVAIAAFYLGRNRRQFDIMRDKTLSAARRGGEQLGNKAEILGGKASGIVRETVMHRADNPNPDDATLRDRVESELFRDPTIPKGQININVAEGVVELRGELNSQDQIDDLVSRVRNIANVRDVHNYLHLPGTPAPNKEQAMRAG